MHRRTRSGRLRLLGGALTTAFFLLVLGASAALAQTPWIHVEVTDGGDDDESRKGRPHVKVNLPLSVVRVAIDAAPDKFVSRGRVHVHDSDIEIADLRRMWEELRMAGDAELVTVEDEDETVRIRRQGDRIRIDVEDRRDDDQVQIDLPVALVDALLSSDGESLNLAAAIDELSDQRGEIVRVHDGDASVRIWIDEK